MNTDYDTIVFILLGFGESTFNHLKVFLKLLGDLLFILFIHDLLFLLLHIICVFSHESKDTIKSVWYY